MKRRRSGFGETGIVDDISALPRGTAFGPWPARVDLSRNLRRVGFMSLMPREIRSDVRIFRFRRRRGPRLQADSSPQLKNNQRGGGLSTNCPLRSSRQTHLTLSVPPG